MITKVFSLTTSTVKDLTVGCALYRSFGGCVLWESHDAPGATYDEQEDTITH